MDEAKELKAENQQDSAADMNKAMNSKFQMPDRVTSYKLYGDFRGRYHEVASTDGNKTFADRDRFRHRLRTGVIVSMTDNLEAGCDQLVDDDNGAYYQNATTGGAVGYYAGTNVKGSLIKANYSITDALTFTFSCFLNELISPNLNAIPGEPKNSAIHAMADLMWKF